MTLSLVLKAFQVVLGSWNPEFTICPFRARIWPFQAPKTLRFKGRMANFEAKNTIKQEKNAKRTNGTHFRCIGGGGVEKRRGEENHHEGRPSQKGVLDPPPSSGTFSTPQGVIALNFPVQKIHDRADQKLCPEIFGRTRSLVRFHTFCIPSKVNPGTTNCLTLVALKRCDS